MNESDASKVGLQSLLSLHLLEPRKTLSQHSLPLWKSTTMSNHEVEPPKVKDFGTRDPDAECTEDFGILNGLYIMAAAFS